MKTLMKVTKEELLKKIDNEVFPHINFPYPVNDGALFNMLRQSIELAIKDSINDAMRVLVTQMYSTEEFEQDLGLK